MASKLRINSPHPLVVAATRHPAPPKLTGGTAQVGLSPAGKAFLTARTGHPGFTGNMTPAGAFAATRSVTTTKPQRPITATKTGSRSTGGSTVKADPLTRWVNRMIANTLTPQQQNAQIKAVLDTQLKAQRFETNSAYDQQTKTLAQQEARARQYAMALNSLRDQSGAQAQADYRTAAADIQGLGTGLTGTIADAQRAEADQAAQQIAAATGGLGQAKGLDVEGMKNIAQYTGVTMPARNLFDEAANKAAEARWNQDIRGQQVLNLASDYRTKAGTAEAERASKLAGIAATRPSLYQKALQDARSASNTNAASIISGLALVNTAAKTPSEIAENVASAGATTKNADTGAAKITGMTSDGKLAKGYYWGPGKANPVEIPKDWLIDPTDPRKSRIIPNKPFYWNGPGKSNPTLIPPRYMLDPNDPTHHKIILNPQFAPGGSKGPKAETPAQRDKRIQALIDKTSKSFASGGTTAIIGPDTLYVHDNADQLGVKKYGEPHQYKPKMSYAAAVADIKKKLPPAVRNNPQMLALINGYLKTGGYKIPKGSKVTKVKTAGKPALTGPSANDLLGLP